MKSVPLEKRTLPKIGNPLSEHQTGLDKAADSVCHGFRRLLLVHERTDFLCAGQLW